MECVSGGEVGGFSGPYCVCGCTPRANWQDLRLQPWHCRRGRSTARVWVEGGPPRINSACHALMSAFSPGIESAKFLRSYQQPSDMHSPLPTILAQYEEKNTGHWKTGRAERAQSERETTAGPTGVAAHSPAPGLVKRYWFRP